MKFQNCILINFVTDGGTDKPKAICPFNFSKVGSIESQYEIYTKNNYPFVYCKCLNGYFCKH